MALAQFLGLKPYPKFMINNPGQLEKMTVEPSVSIIRDLQ